MRLFPKKYREDIKPSPVGPGSFSSLGESGMFSPFRIQEMRLAVSSLIINSKTYISTMTLLRAFMSLWTPSFSFTTSTTIWL
jgi:hypothetical protein